MSDDNVNQERILGDLTGLRETKDALPQASGVRVKIEKATLRNNSYEGSTPTKEYLNLMLRLVEGINLTNENGEYQTKYTNKVIFSSNKDLVTWVDTKHEFYQAAKWKKGSYLIPLRQFWLAVGKDSKNVVINDVELSTLEGIEVLVDIGQTNKRMKNPDTGEWETTGEVENVLRNWRQA